MNGLTKPLYTAVGALCVLGFLSPLLIQLFVVAVPLVVVAGLVVIVVRLVWFYTDRY